MGVAVIQNHQLYEDDSRVWILSLLISLLLYVLLGLFGTSAWKTWKQIPSSTVSIQREVKVQTAAQDVVKQIQMIEIKKREIQRQEIAAAQLKEAALKSKNQKRSVTKNTAQEIQKNKLVKKDISSRSQNEKFNIPLADLLARSQALANKPVAGVAQATGASKAFNLTSVAIGEKAEVSSDLLVADRLSGSTYEGGLVAHAQGPQGLIFRPARDELEISEGLPLELIQMVVEENEIQLRYCYEIQLLKSPSLEGEVGSEWKITAEGSIESVHFSSTQFEETGLFSCLEKKMKAWKFPKPKGGVSVSVKYPMRFLKKEVL
jgi:hypothetical protein